MPSSNLSTSLDMGKAVTLTLDVIENCGLVTPFARGSVRVSSPHYYCLAPVWLTR